MRSDNTFTGANFELWLGFHTTENKSCSLQATRASSFFCWNHGVIPTAVLTSSVGVQLVDEAHHRWLVEEEGVVDDITAVVVHFTYTA